MHVAQFSISGKHEIARGRPASPHMAVNVNGLLRSVKRIQLQWEICSQGNQVVRIVYHLSLTSICHTAYTIIHCK